MGSTLPSQLAELAVTAHEVLNHRRYQSLCRQRFGKPVGPGVNPRVIREIAQDRAGQFHGHLDWPVLGNRSKPQFAHSGSAVEIGSSTKSRVTMTRNAKPGRTEMVGGIAS